LTNAQVSDSGSYDVVVSNSSGANQSSAVVLTVNPAAPFFTQQPSPASSTNYVGGLVTFGAGGWHDADCNCSGSTMAPSLFQCHGQQPDPGLLQTNEAGSYTLLASNSWASPTASRPF
jgi:hypothetical protein